MIEPIAFVDLQAQYALLKSEIHHRIQRVLDHGQFILGPEVRELEECLSAYTATKHCITVASGTEALLMALMALGVGVGDEVITTAFTFVATAEVIVLLGATPVFVDIQPDTCNINPPCIAAAITSKTKAIIVVSLYGQPPDMDEINAIAQAHQLPVIEDAAQSFGATYRMRRSTGLSTMGCTSFFPSKPLGCYGDGGAIFTNDDTLAQALREIRVHGQSQRYYHTRIGVGGRMDTLQCAIVLAKWTRFHAEVTLRIAAGARYLAGLNGVPGVTLLQVRSDRTCVWGQFTIQLDHRDAVALQLAAEGIPTAVHYPIPLHRQPAYQAICRVADTLIHTESVATRVLSLPMHAGLDAATQQRIIQVLIQATKNQ